MIYFNLAPLRNMCIKFAMQFIQRKVSLNKCLKFKMPKVPKIVERASSTIDLISNVQW
jgi:ArsR family metal-binding transcriptional regulator